MTRRLLSIMLASALCAVSAVAQVSVEECVALARDNYPLIQKYDILNKIRQTDLSDIGKTWLPRIGLYARGTVQNDVPSFPDALSDVLDRMGTGVEGLGRMQYKAGVDVSQTIWDGGAAKSRRKTVATANAAQVAATDVQLYAVRERVENLFFGILLLEEQIRQTGQTLTLLDSNLKTLRAMKAAGTAMQSDVDMVEAQALTVRQQMIEAKSRAGSYRRLLGIYTGRDMTGEKLAKPAPAIPDLLTPARPEQMLFDARMLSNEAQRDGVKSSVMPRIGFFAQAYYGYPGFNYFKSMTERNMSFNVLAGVKVSWNIDSFYTKKNSERRLRLADDGISADRDMFFFDTGLLTQSQTARITELKDVIKEDARIVELRVSVRRAAESQLANGVIDATTLLSKITDENNARITASYHELQLIQSICQLKYTLNR